MSKKWLLPLFASLVLFFVFSQIFLRSRFVSKKIEQYAASSLEAVLGQEVNIGEAKVGLLSASVVLKDLTVGIRKPGQTPAFFAKEVGISFSPVSFFTEAFLIREIRIASPVLSFPNKILQKTAPMKSPAKSMMPPPIIVRALRIIDGSVTFKSASPLQLLSLKGIDAEIRPNLKMSRFEIEVFGEGGAFSQSGVSGKIDSLEAELVFQERTIDLKRFSLNAQQVHLESQGLIHLSEKPSFDLSLDFHAALEALSSFQLPVFLEKKRDGKALSGDVHFSGTLSGEVQNPLIKGRLSLEKMTVDGEAIASIETELSLESRQLALSHLSGTLLSAQVSGSLEADFASLSKDGAPDNTDVTLKSPPLKMRLRYEKLPLSRISGHLIKADLAQDPRLKGIFLSGDLDLSFKGSGFDQMKAKGQMSAQRLALFSPPLSPDAKRLARVIALFQKGEGQWRWEKGHLALDEGRLHFPQSDLAFHGTWQPKKGLDLETELNSAEIQGISEAMRLPFSGQAGVKGQFRHQNGIPAFKGRALLMHGLIRAEPFERLSTDLDIQGKILQFKAGRLRGYLGGLQGKRSAITSDYRIKGALNLEVPKVPRFDFQVQVSSGNPQEVFGFFRIKVPLYTRVRGSLDIQGIPKSFVVKGPLILAAGALYGERFETGRLDLRVTEKAVHLQNALLLNKKSRLSGKGSFHYDKNYSLALKGDHLRIEQIGFLKKRFPELKGEVGLVVSGKGHVKRPELRFIAAVKELHFGEMEVRRGTLKADWEGKIVSYEGDFPEQHFALSGELRLLPQHPFRFESRFEQLRIDPLLRASLPEALREMRLQASGSLKGHGKLAALHQISLSGEFKALRVGLGNYHLKNEGPLVVASKRGRFSFQDARLVGENTALTLNGSLTLKRQWNLFVRGEADLKLISFFSKQVTSAKGKAFLDLEIRDRWDQPRMRGAFHLKEGRIRLASLSQSFRINTLSALFNQNQLILETLEGHVGGGDFHAEGKAALSGFWPEDFGFLLSLNGARVDLAEGLPATIDGELFLQRKGSQQILKGDLTLREIAYDKKINLGAFVVDLINPKNTAEADENLLFGRTEINVHLFGKEKIRIANNVARIPLAVDLFLKGSIDRPVVIGRVDVSRGEVFFRGNTFKVLSGSLDFLNPEKIDPSLHLKARTDVRNTVSDRRYAVDLDLSGTLSQINLRFASFPSLPEADILALLAIGKTTADLEGLQGGAGSEARNFVVSEFLGEPIEKFVGKPVEKLTGIDRIRVDPNIDGSNPNAATGTKLTAEKRLFNDRMVVIYSTTLDPSEEDLIRMMYEINKHISLIGKRDGDGQLGGDIRFRFEFR